MSIKRGPDGVPIDIPSTKYKGEPATEDAAKTGATTPNITVNLGDEPTIMSSGSRSLTPNEKPPSESLFLDEPATEPAANRHSHHQPEKNDDEITLKNSSREPETVIARGGKKRLLDPEALMVPTKAEQIPSDAMVDPVVGWLVVIEGPGQGNFLKLGYGQNSIGRQSTERVVLDFGDDQISRQCHATVTYDPRGGAFYIQPGTGTNLTYVNDEKTPVLQPMVLEAYSHISIGDTILRFIPFCGDDFSWDER